MTLPDSAAGAGAFSFADGLSTVGAGDLTAFRFSQTVFVGPSTSNPFIGSSTFEYGLADITGFSLTLTGTTPTAFTLDTSAVAGNDPNFPLVSFAVFDAAGSFLGQPTGAGGGIGADILGPVTFTPEPPETALLMLAAVLVGVWAVCRRPYSSK
ncbi:MAG TPA: hypothetical protein VK604_19960 [Bryobacteraceae bacterium]|nr:hypothetical protein [Bryobacteraceae bacterium]HTF64444.1 hypothetical protein [Edaphobacter sp.]